MRSSGIVFLIGVVLLGKLAAAVAPTHEYRVVIDVKDSRNRLLEHVQEIAQENVPLRIAHGEMSSTIPPLFQGVRGTLTIFGRPRLDVTIDIDYEGAVLGPPLRQHHIHVATRFASPPGIVLEEPSGLGEVLTVSIQPE
jgi:hypothetical protein